jgi:hypothetical protein
MTPASPEQERPDAATSPTPPSVPERTTGRKFGEGHDTRHPTPDTPVRPRRRLVCASLLLALSALLTNLSGCTNSFSGGSFPIGKAFVVGRVVSAEDPQIVFKGVKITLLATPPGGESKRFDAITDANGNFQFDNVPTGQISGAAQLSAISDDATIRGQSLFFSLINQRKRGLFIALPKTSFDVSQAASIRIVPPTFTLPPGDTVRIDAQLRDINDNILPVLPSLIYDADLGTVGGDGTFAGMAAGTGSITAQWYGNLTAVASIRVDPNAPSLPPPAPRAISLTTAEGP